MYQLVDRCMDCHNSPQTKKKYNHGPWLMIWILKIPMQTILNQLIELIDDIFFCDQSTTISLVPCLRYPKAPSQCIASEPGRDAPSPRGVPRTEGVSSPKRAEIDILIWPSMSFSQLVGWLIEGFETTPNYNILQQVNDGRCYTKPTPLFLPKGHYWIWPLMA